MDRRAFLSGLFGVAGVAALGGLTMGAAQAAPIARVVDPNIKLDAVKEAGRTPDGTPVDEAHYTGWRHNHRRRGRGHRRGRGRRRSRVVCRTTWHRGRRIRRCRRVYW